MRQDLDGIFGSNLKLESGSVESDETWGSTEDLIDFSSLLYR